MKRSFATLLGLALLAALVPVVAVASCAAADTQITLTDFDADGEQIYVAVEDETPKEAFTAIRRGLSCNDNESVRVDYELEGGSASGVEVQGGNSGTLTLQAPPRSGGGSGFSATRDFVAPDDMVTEDVQHATLRLQNVGEAGLDQVKLGFPREAPVFVVDDDNTETPFGFGMSSYSRQESFTLGVPVFRSGPVGSAGGSVGFTVAGSGADPAETNDYTVHTASPLQFDPGERVKMIEIEMREDFAAENDEQLTVSLEGGQASAETRTTDVTIENLSPSSGALRPSGLLHHPKHNFKYPQNYPWLNEIHIFTASADRDLRVTRAEMSIVKKMKNDSCRWWNGKRFIKDRCINRRWFDEGIKKPAKDYFLHRLKQRFPLSVGKKSNVAYYEIQAKWWDNRNNVSSLRVGKNKNRFDVIKPTKACRDHPFNFRKCKPGRP